MQRILALILALVALVQTLAAQAVPGPVQIVSTVTVRTPGPILRATLPMEPGVAWASTCPVTVAVGGARCPTQWEPVATWPDGSVRVAEVLAVVPPASGPTAYQLVAEPWSQGRCKPGPWAAEWIATAPKLLLDARPPPSGWGGWHRRGEVALSRRFHGPNLFGWVTVWHGLDVVGLDVVFHNGHPGSPDLFFDTLALTAPDGGQVSAEMAWPDPGVRRLLDGRLALVGPRGDGKAHGLVQRGAHAWSLVLHDGSQDALARALAEGGGWGVSDAWTRVDAYGVAALRLPDLGYRASQLKGALWAEWDAVRVALATGSPYGLFTGGRGRLDWQHPYNPTDGGSTGGGGRHQWHGVELASCGETAGLLAYQARLATIMDRHACAIVRPDGQPIVLEQWLDSTGKPKGGWVTSGADCRFDGKTDGAFGFAALQGVTAGIRTPPELALLKQPIAGGGTSGAFEPIDFQHLDRAIQDAEALVWLSNSPVAAWWLRMNAETWRMAQASKGRLDGEHRAATSSPGRGCGFGREDGHGERCAILAYAISEKRWRSRWEPWLAKWGEVYVSAQMPNGLVYRSTTRKQVADYFGNAWAISKGTEEALVANAALGLARSVRLRPALGEKLVAAVDRWGREGLWRYLWNGGAQGTATDYIGVAPLAGGTMGEVWTDPTTVKRHGFDSEEIIGPLGSSMLLRKIRGEPIAPEQAAVARKWCGGAIDPRAWLRSRSLYALKLDDCAPLAAALDMP